jgi:hypothetical protein
MARIKGITVTLISNKQVGTDPFDNPIFEDVEIEVHNVLVKPTSTEDVVNTKDLTGRTAIYTLAIPKGDSNVWENQEVKFFGERWRVFGIPKQGIEELIPLDWNKKVMVERYE